MDSSGQKASATNVTDVGASVVQLVALTKPFFVSRGAETVGPLSFGELRDRVLAGELGNNDLVCQENWPGWCRLDEVLIAELGSPIRSDQSIGDAALLTEPNDQHADQNNKQGAPPYGSTIAQARNLRAIALGTCVAVVLAACAVLLTKRGVGVSEAQSDTKSEGFQFAVATNPMSRLASMPSPPKIVKADPELAKRARLEWLGSQMRRSGVEDSRIQQVLLLGGPNTFIPALQSAWRAHIPQIWAERGTPLPAGVAPADSYAGVLYLMSGLLLVAFVDEFVQAVQEVFPRCCIQFEDFTNRTAMPLL